MSEDNVNVADEIENAFVAGWRAALSEPVPTNAQREARERGLRVLQSIQPKPRTTVKRFALDLKARIERAAVGFKQPGQDELVAGMRYVLGIVDAALSDYDVRDPGDM